MSDVRHLNIGKLTLEPLEGHAAGLRVIGDLDVETVPRFREALAALPPHGSVTLDLSELTFIDSSGLHAILERAHPNDGGPVILTTPTEFVRRVLEILNLDEHPGIEIRADG